ncbi:UDP-glycosyltransferase UGT5-like isoform X2 [Leptidea sinapis]|nr:UDP-glycosyltransferase UGT5-like isoform X2 [Leptidea sinapis]XP_050679563.1 UDP-glycosyltransferase UGT5-like isoform X2 [Leptidea sinapis]
MLLEGNLRSDPSKIFNLMVNVARDVLADRKVQKLLNNTNQNYDVVITEWMNTEIYSGFSAVFDCPFIWFFPFDQYLEIFRIMHTPAHPAYTPNIRTRNIPPFNFRQRLQELWYQMITLYTRNFKFSPIEEKAYRQYFEDAVKRRGRKLPDYNEIKYNASLAFSNSHISLRDVPELPLALKMIGGFHIETHIKPLPNNLQVIMNKSTNGVILFSMGTQLTTGGMPSELTNELLKAFGDLPYTVLWRFDDDQLKDIPDNIIVQSWIPQLSILAHPNCVLFITHGGLLSLTESIHTGVPIIGIPVFADQFLNVDTAVKNGYGRRVELSFTMSHVLREEIHEVINNPQYSRKAKELSLIYHDRLVPPGVELVHWVEHVVKTRGAHHLRSPALHLPLYQKLYFDLLAFAILILFLFFILYRYIVIKLSYLKRKIKIT